MSPKASTGRATTGRKRARKPAKASKSGAANNKRVPTLKARLTALVQDLSRRGIRLEEATDALERAYLEQALQDHDGNQSRAAAALQLHRNTLRRKLARHGLI